MSRIVKKIILRSSLVCVLVCIVLYAFLDSPLSSIYGLTFSYLMSVLMLLQMNKTSEKAVLMKPSRAEAYVRAMYMLRLLMYAIVLTASIVADYLNFFAALGGLVIIKYTIVLSTIFDADFLQDRKKK